MKKFTKILPVILAAAMALTALCAVSSADTGNLLTNGSASNGMNGWKDPDGLWKTDTNYDGVKAYDSYYFHPKGYTGSNGTRIYQDVSVKNYIGMKAVLSAQNRAFNTGNDASMLKIEFFNSSGSLINSASSEKDPGVSSWHLISVSAKVPDNAVTARVSLYSFFNSGSESDSYFDNVSLTMSGTPSSSTSESASETKTDAMFRIYLEEGESLRIAAVIGGKTASSVKYSTSDSKIAKVTSKNKIKAVSPGTAVITAKSGSTTVKIQVVVEEDD